MKKHKLWSRGGAAIAAIVLSGILYASCDSQASSESKPAQKAENKKMTNPEVVFTTNLGSFTC